MNVLVTGASGFVGGTTAKLLDARGHAVRRTVRRPDAAVDRDTVRLEIGPATEWGPALQGIDTVVHAAGYVHRPARGADAQRQIFRVNAEGTRTLTIAARNAGVKTLVFISSIGAAAERSIQDLDESVACRPLTPYGRSKLAAERAIHEECGPMRAVILRPPLVYGNGAPGNFARLVAAIRRRWPLPFGAIANRRSFIFVGNLTDAIVTALEDERADGVYHVADDAPVSTPQFIRAVAAALNTTPRLWSIPEEWLLTAGKCLGVSDDIRKLTDSLPIDATRFQRTLAWTPPWHMQRALLESFRP